MFQSILYIVTAGYVPFSQSVWSLCSHPQALYFESSVGSTMKALELREAGISPWAINRLAR